MTSTGSRAPSSHAMIGLGVTHRASKEANTLFPEFKLWLKLDTIMKVQIYI